MAKTTSRQYRLVASQPLLGDNSGGEGLVVGANASLVSIPPGARVLDAYLAIDVVFDGTTPTIALSSTNSSVTLSATSAAAVATTAATVDRDLLTTGDEITATLAIAGGSVTTGSGRLIVEYIVDGRANELHR